MLQPMLFSACSQNFLVLTLFSSSFFSTPLNKNNNNLYFLSHSRSHWSAGKLGLSCGDFFFKLYSSYWTIAVEQSLPRKYAIILVFFTFKIEMLIRLPFIFSSGKMFLAFKMSFFFSYICENSTHTTFYASSASI